MMFCCVAGHCTYDLIARMQVRRKPGIQPDEREIKMIYPVVKIIVEVMLHIKVPPELSFLVSTLQ